MEESQRGQMAVWKPKPSPPLPLPASTLSTTRGGKAVPNAVLNLPTTTTTPELPTPARVVQKALPSRHARGSTSRSALLKTTPGLQNIKSASLLSAIAHDSKSVSTPLKNVPKAGSFQKDMQIKNQGPKIAPNKEKVNLKKCRIDLGKFSNCRRVGKEEERYKIQDFNDDIKSLKDCIEDEKENLKLVMVHDQDVTQIKMLAQVESKAEMVTSENIDKVAKIFEAEVRPKKKVKPTMVTDNEVAEILETGTRPKTDMAEIKMLTKVESKILTMAEIKMLTKVESKVQLVMVADEGVDKILEAKIRSKKKVKPTMVTDEEVSEIAEKDTTAKKRVRSTIVTGAEVAAIQETETRPNKLASLKDALARSSDRPAAFKKRVRPVMVTDENVVEIKPAKMVLNLWMAEKEFNEKVKLMTVSDEEVEKLKDIEMSNNASNIKRSGKDLKVPMIQMSKSVIKIQKLGKKTSLERRVKLTMVMDEKVPQVNDI